MKKILIILLFFAAGAVLSAGEVKIDLKNSVIVQKTSSLKVISEDLKTHLELIGGGQVPIVPASKIPPGKYVFHVGKAPKGTKKTFKKEEGRYIVTDKAAYFFGDTEYDFGINHAVYTFLDEALCVRWPGVDLIAAVKRNPVIVSQTEGRFIPELNIRGIRKQGIWNRRMKMGFHNPPQYGHAFTNWWKLYGKTHPEYFALNQGNRAPTYAGRRSGDMAQVLASQKYDKIIALCVSNEKVWARIIENWKKAGMPEYVNICENDAPDILSCHCSNCMKLDVLTPEQQKDWTHALADRYVYFANNVLARAKKYRKDVKVSMYAYNASQDAPRREKLSEDIVIGIVPTSFTLASLEKYVSSWKKMGLKHFFYRPNRHYYYAMMCLPAGFEKHFYNVMKLMVKEGCIGLDYDSNKNFNPSVQLSDYIIAKAMQNPSASFEECFKHYLEAYGNAGSNVGRYFEYWRKEVWEKRIEKNLDKITTLGAFYNYSRGLVKNITPYYKESDFVKAGKYLDAAMKTPGLTDIQKALVKRLADFNEHGRLFYVAMTVKNEKNSIALLKYRQKNNLPILEYSEQYYGDIAGLKRVMDLAEFTPPFIKTPLFWKFKLDPEDAGQKEKWYKEGRNYLKWKYVMATNNNWERPYAHYKVISNEIRALTRNYNGFAWYATDIKVPSDWFGKRDIYLYFGAVDDSCTIYVNGEKVHYRPYVNLNDWTTPFSVDITKFVKGDGRTPQYITVRVGDKGGAGGIWKEVFLVSKEKK